MLDINHEILRLQQSRLLRTEKEIKDFEEAIENILELNDVNHIPALFKGFDDNTNNDEVMFGLIHAIESYDNEHGIDISMKRLIESIPQMYSEAKEWIKILNKRILNDDFARHAYIKVLSESDLDNKKLIVEIITEIKDENPAQFEKSANDLIVRIDK